MKQNDKLEQFIRNNRSEFDAPEPPVGLWDKIEPGVSKKKPVIDWQKVIIRLAAVIAIFIAAYYFHEWRTPEIAVQHKTSTGEFESIQVLVEAEGYYMGKIDEAKNEVTQLASSDDKVIELMNTDLDELTSIFNSLKNDLRDDSDNQEVIEAMIQNYRIRLQILEEMLKQLKKSDSENKKTDSNEI
ncbi:MAG: hypothetical protein KDC05_16640 [Bacteroidales bacterium]|nr:hypothetical protein [Bacteroidales bacterium]